MLCSDRGAHSASEMSHPNLAMRTAAEASSCRPCVWLPSASLALAHKLWLELGLETNSKAAAEIVRLHIQKYSLFKESQF